MERIKDILDTYLKNTSGELNILGLLVKIIIIVILIRIIIIITNKLINRTLRDRNERNYFSSNKRANTIGEVLKKAVKYVLYFIGIMMILEMFDINTNSILATAGIGGLAIGFGAQSLVKDILTGFFILLEDQYAIGDYVKIQSFEGVVESLGMRVTKLRDFSGDLHIIPNGNINIVTNMARGAMRSLVRVTIPYDEDIDRVIEIMTRACKQISDSNDSILDGPNILGVTELGEAGPSITIVAKTKPMNQWAVERQIRKAIKEAFDKEDIKIAYPRIVVHGGKEK